MLITNRFNVTLLDDLATDPQVNQTIDFTDNSWDNYVTKTVTLTAVNSSDWKDNPAEQLFDEPTEAKYIVIQPTKLIHCYLSDPGNPKGDPNFSISNLFVLNGTLSTLYAVSSVTSSTSKVYVKLIYVY